MSLDVILATIGAGVVGAVLRYLASRALSPRSDFPWAVLIVNVVGSAIGGVVLGLAANAELSADLRVIILTGFCGGLTTFSTWSVETVQLAQDGRWRAVALSVVGNLVLGIGSAAAAFAIVTGA